MKSKKTISIFFAVIMAVFCFPQFGGKAEAATTNYTRAMTQYSNIVNVADYGIDTSGKRDCAVQITKLVKSLAKERTDESEPIVLYFPTGKYIVKDIIKLYYNNVHLIAEKDTVVTAKKSIKNIIEANNVDNVSVLGGKWDGNYKSKYIIKVNKATNITVSECTLTRSSERGFYAIASEASVYSIKSFKNKKYGVSGIQGSNITMKNSNIYQNSVYGLCIVSSTIHMEDGNNKIYNNDYTGAAISGKSGKIYASNNSFTGNGKKNDSRGHGIGISGAYGELSNNKIEKNKQCGISFDNKGSAIITNNSIKNNGRHGIGAANKSSITAEGNTITGNKWHGIMLRDKSTGTLTNNSLSKNKLSGLNLTRSTATLTGNTFYANKSNGIMAAGSKATLTNNTITKNKAFGIYTSDSSKINLIGGNVVKSNSKGDIDAGGSKVTIGKDNTVKKIVN
ncbi:hypothetical protein CG709_16235 [Lachnotalea glycerini]|nr:hypothetical protein CG709_16235 [Lachnotalea glycerini]